MILGFKKQFNESILNGTKIHSIRAGKRWRAGMVIHFYNHVRTKKMTKFREDGVCISVQDIMIEWEYGDLPYVYNDGGEELSFEEIEKLALNDGFESVEQFFGWFNESFKGQIIHWTNFRY